MFLISVSLWLQEGPFLKSKGKASCVTKIAVLTWRSLLIMSREWKYYWLRLILYMFLALCIGTVFSGLGHSLSSVGVSYIISANSLSCFFILIEIGAMWCATYFESLKCVVNFTKWWNTSFLFCILCLFVELLPWWFSWLRMSISWTSNCME